MIIANPAALRQYNDRCKEVGGRAIAVLATGLMVRWPDCDKQAVLPSALPAAVCSANRTCHCCCGSAHEQSQIAEQERQLATLEEQRQLARDTLDTVSVSSQLRHT